MPATVELPAATPAEMGFSASILDERLGPLLGEHKTGAAALLVKGRLVWERYWDGHGPATKFDVYSMGKAYAAAAIGLLADDGLLSLDDPACKFLPEWKREGNREILIKHLLTMTSGLKLEYEKFTSEPDPTAATLAWPVEHRPGTVWSYEQATAHALCPIVVRVSGKQPIELLRERVLGPIGAGAVEWLRAANGDCKTWRSTLTSARDVCKFGWLLLKDGRWGERQLLSAEFCRKMRTRDPLFRNVVCDPRQQELKARNYGYLQFLNVDGMWPDADPRVFAPTGAYANLCLIDPVRETVLARLVTPADVADHKPYSNKLDSLSGGTNEIWKVLREAVVGEQ
ncbi:MAG: beta-lactamase family protein [Planctomycetota bacterium]|nr:beta-lactamase family protein [Planctomycetota bacterium]